MLANKLANKFAVLSDLQNLQSQECVDETERLENDTETVRNYLPSFRAKGKNGQHKKYFKGGCRKRKRKPKMNLECEVGKSIVFESKSGEVGRTSLYIGIVKERTDATYVVESNVDQCRLYNVTNQDHPKPVKDLIVGADELKKGGTVLVAWNIVGGFVELVPAQVVEVVGNDNVHVWVKTMKGECAKVHVDNVIKTTRPSQVIQREITNDDNSVRYEDINLIRLMLRATQSELDTLKDTYQRTLKQLDEKETDDNQVQQQKQELQKLYHDALTTAEEYREELLQTTVTTQKLHSLQEIITKQTKDLDSMSNQIIALQSELKTVRQEYEEQSKEIEELKRQNRDLIQKQNELYVIQSPLCGSAASSSASVVQAKRIGNKTRPTSFLPIAVPTCTSPSSRASRQTLKRRGDIVKEVLNILSARDNPTSADVIQTLAAFLRQNPDVALPACKAAKINFATELDANDAVDLKILLRLPMTRMRDLRRFLGKFGVNIVPSDKRMYKEISDRQYQGKDTVEVGVVQLKKTSAAPETPVAFFRVNSLEDYLISHIEKQLELGNVVHHEDFKEELWIKIGGDKGDNSTKLAFQFVNQKHSNSAAATNILSMFEAFDSYENMECIFGNFYEQITELQRRGTLTIKGKIYQLRFFYFGDTEYLCKTFGHMGPSSSYPCLWCKIPLKDLRNTNGQPHCPMRLNEQRLWEKNNEWRESRTKEDYQQDLANLLTVLTNDEQGKISGKDHHSISKRPLFPFPEDLLQIVPPSLHILLGLVVRYFKLIEDKCRELDQTDVQDGVQNLDRRWQANSEEAKKAENDLLEAKEALNEEEAILHSIEQAAAGRSTKGVEKRECCMPLCKLKHCIPTEVKHTRVGWIQCVKCGQVGSKTKGWFHTFCVGISDEDAESDANDSFTCPLCKGEVSGPEDVLNLQSDKVKTHRALVQDKQDEYARKKKVLDDVYEEVMRGRGEFERNLNDMLQKIGVQRQAYHSQCFVGNHCKLILENTDKLIAILPNSEFKKNIEGLFRRFRWIFKFFKAGFLTDDEVKALRMRCWELGTWFPKHFPSENIPPKFHMLVCHVPEFVYKWKTIGLLSEHGIESLHKDINSIERIYCSVGDSQDRMKLVIGNHQQRSTTSTTSVPILAQHKKVCYMSDSTGCTGRYKAAFKGAKERVCTKCGHVIKL